MTDHGDARHHLLALLGLPPGDTPGPFAEAARVVRFEAGLEPYNAGSPCESYLVVLSGSVRVQVTGRGGREIVLYRVGPGQPCILTTSCLLAGEVYPAAAVMEEEGEVLLLPARAFAAGLDSSEGFRRFVFASFGQRLAMVIQRLEEVAFDRIGTRLARTLLARADGDGRVRATHDTLATELGTAREVVSRELKRFAQQGLVALSRGRITVQDRAGLQGLLEGNGNPASR